MESISARLKAKSFHSRYPKTGLRLSMMLTFTGEGKNDVMRHYEASGSMFLDLKDVVAVMQGVEAQFAGDLADVGPISLS